MDEDDKKILNDMNEKLKNITNEYKVIKKEVFYNRIALGIFLIITLLYIHNEITNLNNTLSILIELFL